MRQPELMKIHQRFFPQDMIDAYNLKEKIIHDGYIYIQIKCGTYGLKQTVRLAYDQYVNVQRRKAMYLLLFHLIFGIITHEQQVFAFALMILE